MRRFSIVACLSVVISSCGTSAPITTSTVATTTSSPTADTTTPPTTSSSTTTTVDDNVDVPRIKVEDGLKTEGLDTLSVRVGETVRFEVEADVADEVHVHGYDLSFETVPDQEVLVEFVADVTGIFEVELEALGLHIVDIEVTP